MSMFDKFCRGKELDSGAPPVDTALPNQFDKGRRSSVSAECWMQACDMQCGQSARLPLKTGSRAAAAMVAPRRSSVATTVDPATSVAAGATASAGGSASLATAAPGASRGAQTHGSALGKSQQHTQPSQRQTQQHQQQQPASLHQSQPQSQQQQQQQQQGDSIGSPDARGTASPGASIPEEAEEELKSEPFPPATATPEERATYERLASALRSTIFFEELSADLMSQVLQALQRLEVPANTTVIQQGDEGDDLFVLDSGSVEYLRDGARVGEGAAGSTFGELALLYNSPRAATVRTLEPSVVYTLDRIIFKRIMVAKLSRKRLHSQRVLASIDVFKGLPESTQLRIADALHPATYHRGDVVIQQGDSGFDFFLIDEGTVEVTIDGEVVGTLGSGSYFGELALIYDLPRAATIRVTSSELKVEALSSVGFERLIGPELVVELRKRDPRH